MVHQIQRVYRLLISSPAIRQSAVMTSGNVITGVVMMVAMILASRSLGPEKFGIFSVSIAVMSILSKGVDLGLNQLFPRLMNKWLNQPHKQKQFLSQVVQWKLVLLASTLLLSLLCIPLLTSFLKYNYPSLLIWAIVGVIGTALFEYVALILAAHHKFFWLAGLGITQGLLKLFGFAAFFFLMNSSVHPIAATYYVAPFIAAGIIGWHFRDIVVVKPAQATSTIRSEIFTFLIHAGIGVIAMTLIINIDVLLVQKYLNEFETGLYAGATRIAGAVGFITASIGGVLNNRVSRYKDKKILKKYLIKSSLLVLVAAIGFISFLPFSEFVVVKTIGTEYLQSVSTLNILVLNTFVTLATVPLISFFYAVNHPKYFSLGGILQVVIILGGSLLFLPRYGITAAAWTKVIASICFALYSLLYLFFAFKKLK